MSLSAAKRLYSQGQQKLATGNLEGAIAKFKQSLRFQKNYYPALLAIGEALRNQGDTESAARYLEQATKLRPDDTRAHQSLDSVLWQIRQTSKLDLKYAGAHCGHGHALWKSSKYKEAVESYQQTIRLYPEYYSAHNGIGNAFYNLGNYEQSAQSYERAIELSPHLPDAYNGLGNALRELGKSEEAIENYQKALRIDPNYCHAPNGLGNVFYDLERYEQSAQSYERAIELSPHLPDAYNGLGNALRELGKSEEAIENYQKALRIDPNYYNAHNGIGNAFYDSEQYHDAFQSYEKAIQVNSYHHLAHNGLGNALWKLNKCDEAVNSYQKSIQSNPNSSYAYNGLGNALWSLKKYEEALHIYRQAIELNPGFPNAHCGYGDTLWRLGQYEKAIDKYRETIKIDPNYHLAYNGLGTVFFVLGHFQKSINSYERTIELRPEYHNPWKGKGQAIWKLHGTEQAIQFCGESITELQTRGAKFKHAIGHLYFLKADAYYQQRKSRYHYSRICLNQSASAYLIAIKIFDELSDREPYLEASQKAIKVLLSLKRVDEADDLLQKGTEQLDRWLEEIPSPAYKKTIALKFSDFNQLTVDRHIQTASQLQDDRAIHAQHAIALETAEKGKNTCLSWLLYATDQPTNPSYTDMQELLAPGRAIAYWHLSPAALTTFILKPGAPAPIVITSSPISQPVTDAPPSEPHPHRPPSLQQLLDLEAWIKDWDDQYIDYRRKDRKDPRPDHSWRKDMGQRLFDRQDQPGNLKAILNIAAIEAHLDGIDHLILVPHRDLHRFPLHALFAPRLIVTYLPSIQVGLARRDRLPTHPSRLLSIGNPFSSAHRGLNLRTASLEAHLIRQYFWQGRSLDETDATYGQVTGAIKGEHTVLHFSGHGGHQFDNPKQSALLLAQDENTNAPKHLTLDDIVQQDFSPYDLVGLSACETAITSDQSITTEYVGLISGFLSQDAAQVISTLWVVQSAACAVIMIEFYRARQLGTAGQLTEKSDALILAETIRWFRNLDGDRFAQWHQNCKDHLMDSDTLPLPQRKKLRRSLDIHLNWASIEPEIQSPYAWAAFTISGGFF